MLKALEAGSEPYLGLLGFCNTPTEHLQLSTSSAMFQDTPAYSWQTTNITWICDHFLASSHPEEQTSLQLQQWH